jgi:hypothetical protein
MLKIIDILPGSERGEGEEKGDKRERCIHIQINV